MGKILTETIERALLLEKNFKDVDLNKDKNSKKIFAKLVKILYKYN